MNMQTNQFRTSSEAPILDALLKTVPDASVEEFVRFINKYYSFIELGTDWEYVERANHPNFDASSAWKTYYEGKLCALSFMQSALAEYNNQINAANTRQSRK